MTSGDHHLYDGADQRFRRFRYHNAFSPKMNKSNLLWLVHVSWKIQVIPAASFRTHMWKACVKLHLDSAMSGQQCSIFQIGVIAQAMQCHIWAPRLDHVWRWSNRTARCHIWAISRNEQQSRKQSCLGLVHHFCLPAEFTSQALH